jgi:hypothetical protein
LEAPKASNAVPEAVIASLGDTPDAPDTVIRKVVDLKQLVERRSTVN